MAAAGSPPLERMITDVHFQYVEKKLKTVPITILYDWEGGIGYTESVRSQIESGDIPEAMQLFGTDFVQELIKAGLLLPLDDLLPNHAPEVWNALTEKEWELVRSFSPDRKIYWLPFINNTPYVGMIRIDWLREVGIDRVPETREELLEAYMAFKNMDANGNGNPNDEIPVSGRAGMRWCDDQFIMHGVSMFYGNPQWRWDPVNKVMINDQVSDEMRNAVEWLRQLIAAGLMDRRLPVQPAEDWFSKLGEDKIGQYFHTIVGIGRRLAMRTSGDNDDAEWVYMPNVKVDGVPYQKYYIQGISPHFAITTEAEDPGRILEWYNWSGTEEGMWYVYFGIEGVNYKMVDGRPGFTIDHPISNKHLYAVSWKSGVGEFYQAVPFGDQIAAVYEASKDDCRFLDNMLMPDSVYEGYEDYEPSGAILYRERVAKMILSELPMSAWENYVEEWYQKGGGEVVKRATEWYKKTYNINSIIN